MPYIEEMVTIGKAENGYVLNVRVPYKETDDDSPECCVPYEERHKNILCKDLNDLTARLKKLLPALTDKMSADDEFEQAFTESTRSL